MDRRVLFDNISQRYDRVNTLLSFGLNALWMRRLARSILDAQPQRHLDLCCGTGAVAAQLIRRCAQPLHIDCVDFSPEMLATARNRLAHTGVRMFLADATALPFEKASYDTVSISYGIRNIPDKEAALCEAARVLRPGGRLCIFELTRPKSLLRPFHSLYLAAIPFLGWVMTGQREPYRYLSHSIRNFSVTECVEALLRQGFCPQIPQAVFSGVATLIIAEKPL